MRKKSYQGVPGSLADLLADPILWMVMKADKVSEAELMELIAAAARKHGVESPTFPAHGGANETPTDYRPGVGIMLLNDANDIFVGRRRKTEKHAWQMPQGGIDGDEDPRAAAFRELKEEIGTDNAEILAESDRWLIYDLPDALIGKVWHGRWRGQRQKWFVMRFRGQDSDINVNTHHAEFSAWKWVPIDDLPDLIVSFKRPLYLELLDAFAETIGTVTKKGG
jgi:putative (di)nucleoside polyphosphate hydrolase